MRASRSSVPRLALAACALAWCTLACIPSFPPCTCEKDSGDGLGEFPDFDALERDAACADLPLPGDADPEGCGYPDGPYGFEEGDVIENLELYDCEGNPVQLAQFLPQESLPEVEARGVVFGIGAAWCAPCKAEAEEWRDHFVDEYEGVQFIQALDEGAVGAATKELCAGWSAANAGDKFPILWTPDQGSLQLKIEGGSGSPLPFTLIFNANGTIVFKKVGEVVDSGVLSVQLDQLISDPYGTS